MSILYYLVSETEAVNIGQMGCGFGFYSGVPACMKALRGFLESNTGETLRLLNEDEVDRLIEAGAVVEIEWEDERHLVDAGTYSYMIGAGPGVQFPSEGDSDA